MNLFKFLSSKAFLWNLLTAFVLFSITFFLLLNYLDEYTFHGESLTVPDFKGMNIKEMESFLKNKQLRYKIIDSTYIPRQMPGKVIDQDPTPDTKVKQNRTIYLTITCQFPPMVKMPDLIDISVRQVNSMLESRGLKLGEIIYKPDLTKDVVLNQLINGNPIKPGVKIAKGTSINLIVGNGLGSEKVKVPDLIGLTKSEAIEILQSSFLSIGVEIYTGAITDTASTKVYRQIPPSGSSKLINQGQPVDLFFRQ